MVDRILAFSAKYPLDMVSYLILLPPFLLGLFFYPKLQKEEKIFIYYFLFVFLKETAALLIMLSGSANMYLQNVQTFIDIIFFGLAYWYALHSKRLKSYLVLTAVACLLSGIYFFDWHSISPMNQVAGRLFSILAVLLFFNDILSELRVVHLSQSSMFWLSTGLLLYAAGTFLLALFGQILASKITSEETFDFFWNIQQTLLILFCLLASLGFWVSKYKTQQDA